jgi:TusA-related sulfurtransferase
MTAPPSEILVDARGLEPPEPMEKVMQTLALLRHGQAIRLLLHREPFPLYPILAERGYRHATTMQADGSYVILITQAGTATGHATE